ncbi:TraB/GumN family protein [Danxiaibacter flavus]|uniref:TraB/GumN family protein n=1 Tax=Danxiaibacter flavus TaxID=3049108 RepID=A0ABV3ZH70_9BACT|nr:TraB/GumN family protein [Chitinophagaceae bacterium DXS]
MFLRLKPILLTALFSAIFLLAFSREPLPKTLLWRISGNGLQKPSFLYGTFHLNDKRLFQFTDSVYHSIETSQGLAIEVNPDEMAAYFVNKLFDEIGKGKKLKDLLSEKDYEKYSGVLSKKLKKPADKITSNDILKEKNKWMSDYFEKGEMPTFMDAYLYNIARRQGKWLGGIEDLSDQTSLRDDLIDQSDITAILHSEKGEADKAMEEMIRLYTSQNIEGIDSFTNETSSEKQKDLILIHRNIKMARRMDSLANERSMFFAVGAAHLPGDSGVIQLLKDRGFNVEPVISANKIAPDKYTFTEVPIPWQKVTDDQNYYSTSMPGNPAEIKMYGVVKMKFLLDLFNFKGYCTMASAIPGNITNHDSLLDRMGKGMYKNTKNVEVNKLSKNGIPGKEFIYTVDNYTNRVQIYFQNNIAYMALISAMKKSGVSDESAIRFFDSLSIRKNIPVVAAEQMFSFNDPLMGVSLNAPAELTFNKELSKSNEGWKVRTFSGVDAHTGSYIFLMSKDATDGLYIVDHRAIFEDLAKKYRELYPKVTEKDRTVNGRFFRELTCTGNKDNPSIHMRIIIAVANNRNIIFSIVGDKTSIYNKQVEDMFSSVRINIKSTAAWNTQQARDSSFTVWAPQPLKRIEATEDAKAYTVTYDSTTAMSFMIFEDTLGKYNWYESDSAFWHENIHFNTETDSVIYDKREKILSGETRSALLESKNKNVFTRTKMLVNGNILYKLFGFGDREILQEENAEKFFNSISFKNAATGNYITISKASLILQDLTSTDSATRVQAYTAITDAPFSKNDLVSLRDALFKNYESPWRDEDHYNSVAVNRRISNKLQKMQDTSAVNFIEKEYPALKSEMRPLALATLAGINTTDSYSALARLLDKTAPIDRFEYSFFGNLEDSLSLTAEIYKHLLPFAKDSVNAPSIAELMLTLVDSGFIKITDIAASENQFIETAKSLLPFYKTNTADSSNYNYDIYSLLKLIGRYNSPVGIQTVKSYLSAKEPYLLKVAALILLEKNEEVNASVFTTIAADRSMRTRLYDDLKEKNKTSLFPRKYLTQSYFAESLVYNAASDEDLPSSLKFLMQKQGTYNGKTYNFFLYKVTYGEGDDISSYLGIAGGFSSNANNIEPLDDVSGVYWEEQFSQDNISKFFKAYLKSLEEEK